MRALIFGWTGETGKELVKQIKASNLFTGATLAGRRNKGKYGLDEFFKQEIVDFEKLDSKIFEGHEHVFCLLGTTRGKAGKEGFIKVDKDYCQNIAQLSKDANASHFHLLTSQGSNANSFFLYPQVKGQVENFCTDLNFPKLTIYQPGLLMCDREESRTGEAIFRTIMKPFNSMLGGSSGSISTELLAAGMLKCVETGKTGKVANKELFNLGTEFKSASSK
ncbi:Oidioi.mRNA.OKI2018_I69.PAR.g13159.t1.cds [Oikopleura dioica]|uniref:Oidioi.mRNA.OKI2018_I69.PAR.g13159.t1.cds n=1 Tax=Oikopleura dioica TaxID=34765 RepID=A0ABN7SBA4_OIKDI|nr:Oidioi.mRNA.OKI2018_I69.PAR.g13159.t1.cds [Oikopleura dioica]